ncbi:MAG: hypothetical protein WCK85_08230 [Chlorobium sp.]
MKKEAKRGLSIEDDTMRAEYDFSGGLRGKHYRSMQAGYTMTIHEADGTIVVKDVMPKTGAIILEPDVKACFPDSESVNCALRCLIPLLSKKEKTKTKKA